ncbi:hypothetical protein BCR39DRAFT_549216 [Naematelia encephala]|uniref:SGNH hydrolase-type esterase domain-containing protein n=1 Tax=Naematelia encephala TaxID=71784 RepID=A0A1Y2ALQ0_9TREE|nr:hypothetical protein BCR39DRAFT_549216 [Naematelia encephala]
MLFRNARPILLVLALLVFTSTMLLLSFSHPPTKRVVMSVVEKVKGAGPNAGGEPELNDLWDDGDEMMREWEFRRSVLYEGTGARIQAFFEKARQGRPFTVSVIGGSVSKGRGLSPPRSLLRRSSVDSFGELPELASRDDDDDLSEPFDASEGTSQPLGATTLYSPENMHVLVFDWLNATFPHPENRLVNGAQGGVGAGYFGWCFKEHIPEDSDLVLVELGINDLIEMDVIHSYERMVRGLLEMDSKPAVINIETFSTLFPTLLSSSAFHHGVAAFYDMPSLSIRDVLMPRILADPHSQLPKWFRTGDDVMLGDGKVREWGGVAVDLMHISALGHALAAGLIIRFLSDQAEKSKPASGPFAALSRLAPSSLRKTSLRILDIPTTSLTAPFDPLTPQARFNPQCRSMNSPRLHAPYPPDDESDPPIQGLMHVDDSAGWEKWAWSEKNYIISKTPGAIASFHFVISPPASPDNEEPITQEELASPTAEETQPSIEEDISRFHPLPLAARPGGPYNPNPIGSRGLGLDSDGLEKRQHWAADSWDEGGRVLLGYQRSATYGLGSVWCWADDQKDEGTLIDGWWEIAERNMGMVTEVASDLAPGPHTLHCELLEHTLDPKGRTEFRIFAIMHD